MEREIKFRAKALSSVPELNEKKWAYGMPVPSQFGCGYMLNIDSCKNADFFNSRWTMPSCESTKPINEDTIGQFTGLKDKNGIDIYEGDIVKTKNGRLCVVKWFSSDNFVGFDMKPIETGHECPSEYDLYKSNNLEVVGNIYDNKELLEE